MNAKSLFPTRRGSASVGLFDDDAVREVPAGSACCCTARAVVRVIMPPTAARARPVDLLLCGHHYRLSRQALAATGATVTLLPGVAGNPSLALIPDLPGPRMPIA
jgi:hypothetical protein